MFDFIQNIYSNFPGISIGVGATLSGVILNIILKKTGIVGKITKLIDKADSALDLLEPKVDAITKKGLYNGGVHLTHKMNNSKAAPVWDTGLEPIVILVGEGIVKLFFKVVKIFVMNPISNITFFITGLRSDNKDLQSDNKDFKK